MLILSISREKPVHSEINRPWYDIKTGISQSLTSLEGFNNLVEERHAAAYDRQERLNEFIILGRYSFDTCGNCAQAIDTIPKELIPDIPDVLTTDEFWVYVREHSDKEIQLSFTYNGGNLPLPGLKCAHCGKTWKIKNCYDTVVRHTTEVYPLVDFVGQTLANVKMVYAQRNDAIYRMQLDIIIRNDKNIDLSLKYPNPEHDWEKSIVKNERGWLDEEDGITDDYVIQSGDEGFFNVWIYFHHTCNRIDLSQNMKARFKEIFEKAGFKKVLIWSIKNEYCSCEVCAPWFNVNTEFGTIKIGWRKRVINIDWGSLQKISSLFEDEGVTKGDNYIHAWSWEKAQEYLTKIYNLLSK
jgi:hypothetical protein